MGWSPLHYASNSSKAKIVQLILNAGISPNIKSTPPKKQKQNDWNLALEENGNNEICIVYPMDVAEGPNRLKIINNLKEKGGKFYGNEITLQQAVQMQNIDEIENLLEDSESKVNARDIRGWLALHYAVEQNNKEKISKVKKFFLNASDLIIFHLILYFSAFLATLKPTSIRPSLPKSLYDPLNCVMPA